jgi:AraC-like DNA-binding protein
VKEEVEPIVPSAGFRLAAVPEHRDGYVAHMSGWKAELDAADSGRAVESRIWSLGGMIVTLNDFPERRVARSLSQVKRDQIDHYQVHLPLGERDVRIKVDDGDEFTLRAGEPVLIDLCRPYAMHQGAGRTVQAYVPREVLDEMLPFPRDMHGRRLQGTVAALLTDLLKSLTSELPRMRVAEASGVAKSALHLMTASLAPTSSSVERARPAVESSLLRQACRYIELHLRESDLDVGRICVGLKVSRATLYRLFEPYGGVACHVKERRLVRIHDELATPSRRQPLARLAEDHGFKSAAQFSRAFREHFGHSPRDTGPSSQVGDALSKATRSSTETYSLADWLRPLRG